VLTTKFDSIAWHFEELTRFVDTFELHSSGIAKACFLLQLNRNGPESKKAFQNHLAFAAFRRGKRPKCFFVQKWNFFYLNLLIFTFENL
jgi:hypothetical protein